MIIKEKYSIRHKILKALQQKLSMYDSKEHIEQNEIELSLQELADKTGLSKTKISGHTNFLASTEEINSEWDKNELKFFILAKGTNSFFDNKYLEEGRKEFWSTIKIVSAVAGLVITILAFFFNSLHNQSKP